MVALIEHGGQVVLCFVCAHFNRGLWLSLSVCVCVCVCVCAHFFRHILSYKQERQSGDCQRERQSG